MKYFIYGKKRTFLKVCLLCVTKKYITYNKDISLEINIITNNTIPFVPYLQLLTK